MAIIGNPIYQSAFVTDQFSGDGTTTAFTMSVAPAGTSNVLVVVSGVVQDPSTYGVVGTTLNFTSAPPSGTGNISCRYLGVPVTGVTTTAYRTVTEFTATASQTTFTPPSYTVGFINVYRNGVLLGSADYTATNGTTVVLATGATAGDLVTVESFQVSSVVNAIQNTAGSVSSSNIATGAVTAAKLASGAALSNIGSGGMSSAYLDSNAQYYGFKNRIINGAMMIDQRNAGASVTPVNDGYMLDRWKFNCSQASKFTAQQSSTAPAGFSNSMLFTVTSAVTVGSTDNFMFSQRVEGFNFADLGWGTADAKPVTLSFWVRSSLTGTFGGSFQNSAENRSYPFTYTISAANTWEQKTVTVAGDTSGTWVGATNGVGLKLWFGLGLGSTYSGTAGAWAGATYFSATGATSVVGTNGATFYITGVQLEKGSTATSFDYRPYGTELALCQRYYAKVGGGANYTAVGSGFNGTTTDTSTYIKFPTSMRASPTVTQSSLAVSHGAFAVTAITSISGTNAGNDSANINFVVASGLTAGGAHVVLGNNSSSAYVALTAEL